jgi:hypothetical protein
MIGLNWLGSMKDLKYCRKSSNYVASYVKWYSVGKRLPGKCKECAVKEGVCDVFN